VRARTLAALAALASLPVLAACDIDARVAVAGDDTVTLDATYWMHWNVIGEDGTDVTATFDPCEPEMGYTKGIVREVLRDPADSHHVGCHITGGTTLAALALVNPGPEWLLHEGGRYHAFVPAEIIRWTGLDETGADPSVTDRGTFRVEVTFPGPVTGQDASARVEGNTVIWDNRGARDLGGAWATSLEEGQLTAGTWAQLAGATGVVVGAAGVSAAWLLRGARRKRDAAASGLPVTEPTAQVPTAAAPVDPAASDPGTDPTTGEDDASVWAPRADDHWSG